MKASFLVLVFLLIVAFLAAETQITADINDHQTWTTAGSPYIINGNISVYGYGVPILTIEAGVEVKFNAGASLIIGYSASSHGGGIVANGSQENPVLFTANTDTPSEGYWNCLRTNSYTYTASTFTHTIFEYGGSDTGMFNVNNYQAHLTPQFDHCVFRHSANYGLYHIGFDVGASVQNSSFENNLGYPLHTNAEQAHKLGAGNTFSGNGTDRVLLRNVAISTPQTWLDQGVPYEAENDLQVRMGAGELLQISPGAELCFREAKTFFVGYTANTYEGGLAATGVTFRGCGAAAWKGIQFQPYISASSLNDCEIRDAGTNLPGAVYLRNTNAEVSVTDCHITANPGCGLYAVDNALFSLSGTFFEQNVQTVSVAACDMHKLGSGNTYGSNTDNRVLCRGGSILESATWTNQGTPVLVVDDITVRSSGPGTLTIPYGTILEFALGTYMGIGYTASSLSGNLIATGVTFRGESASPGHWRGLLFEYYGGSSLLSGCTIRDAGYGNVAAVRFKVPASTMTGCQVLNCPAVGVHYESSNVQVALSGNSISGCGSYPLSLPANCVRAIGPGNDFTGNFLNKVEVRAENLGVSCTWIDPGVPYFLNGTVRIYSGSNCHLKILPGTVLYLPVGGTLTVGYTASSSSGSLEAENVTFTSDPEAGLSYGLLFNPYCANTLCVLDGCSFENMQNNSQNTAVYVNNSLPTFNDCVFQNNPGSGIAGSAEARFTLNNCSFLNNGSYPVRTSAPSFEAVSGTSNFFSGNTPNRIQMSGGTINTSATWNNPSVPVEVTSDINVRAGADCTLKINSGLTLLFQTGSALGVGYTANSQVGTIQADGATFSALNSGAGWDGIVLYPYISTGGYLRNCVVEYAVNQGNIYLYNSPFAEIDGCVIRNGTNGIYAKDPASTAAITRNYIQNNTIGVLCTGNANPTIGGNSGAGNHITGNSSFGVQNTSTGLNVNAVYNWWGHETGPTHTGNPAGEGDAVSDHVDYDPYRDTDIGDAPARFHLLSPADTAVLETLTPVMDWGEAIDPTPGDVVTYTLEIAKNTGFTLGLITISDLSASVYHVPVSTLADDTRYYWRVSATDTQMQTTNSYESYWYLDTIVPEAPLDFDPITPAYNATVLFTSNLLSWEEAVDPDPGDLVTYTIYQDISAGFETAQTFTSDATHIYSGFCAPGSLIYWKVKATDLSNNETFSPVWRFFVDANAKPRAPVDFTLTPSVNDILINWDEVPGADSYDIYVSSDPYTGFNLLQSGLTGPSCLHLGAAGEPKRFYHVIAHDNE